MLVGLTAIGILAWIACIFVSEILNYIYFHK